MLTGQSNFSLVTSCSWSVKIFTKKSSTRNVGLIKPTNIICLFQLLLHRLKIGLIFFWKDLTRRSNGIPIDLECMTNSKWMVFSRSNRYMYALVYVFIRGHDKKEIKTLRFTVGDLIVYSRTNRLNMTWPVNMTSEWSFWRSCHHSGWTLSIDRPLFWALTGNSKLNVSPGYILVGHRNEGFFFDINGKGRLQCWCTKSACTK